MNNEHPINLYNILLELSRNIFFYKTLQLKDNFETRIYLMFMHFSIILILYRRKNVKFDQKDYDYLFNSIENNLRELGFGDVTVNKKMKELNKVLYDILLKIELSSKKDSQFNLNHALISKYFNELNDYKSPQYKAFETYFSKFFNFCFELPLKNVLRDALKFI
tara:strand:+ start:1013 stop:1504 length:492 start_codon:yes stop_codon:yes gene_type:complete